MWLNATKITFKYCCFNLVNAVPVFLTWCILFIAWGKLCFVSQMDHNSDTQLQLLGLDQNKRTDGYLSKYDAFVVFS